MVPVPSIVTLYAAEDRDRFAVYDRHLSSLKLGRALRHTHSGDLLPGEPLARLDQLLRDAGPVVCLLSADFLSNPDLMAQAQAAADRQGLTKRLIPVRLRPVDLSDTVFADLQALPRDGTPLFDGDHIREEALTQVVAGLRDLMELLRRSRGMDLDLDVAYRYRETLIDRVYRETLIDRVEEACRRRAERDHKDVRLRRVQAPPPFGELIEVRYQDSFWSRRYLVAALSSTPTGDDIQTLGAELRSRYQPLDTMAYAELIFVGPPLSEALLQQARTLTIEVQHLEDYQGLIHFGRYIHDQQRALQNDERYPPALYVPQRMVYSRGLGGREETAERDALDEMFAWVLQRDMQRFILVLGEFGVGKTFLLHELARRLGEHPGAPTPVLLEMRSLEKARSLDELIAQHLASRGIERIDLSGFRYMLAEGRIALLFDGFDELALRVSYDRAAEHLDTITQAAQGRAKVVLTSRTQHFRSDDQVKNALARRLEALPGHRAVRLLPFDDGQIRSFLGNRIKDPVQAQARYTLLRDVKDLLGLSENPRMLSFIAQLPEARLRQAQTRGEITAAKLYEELLTWWIEEEWKRAHPKGQEPGLSTEQRWAAVEKLAQRLWQQTESWVTEAQLGDVVSATLLQLKDVGVAVHQVGAGTLLCRDGEGRFSFIHQSVMEWLVAKEAARRVAAGGSALYAAREISPLMADFFTDLLGHEAARAWARDVGKNHEARDIEKSNALLIRRRLGDSLSGQDLAGQDLREHALCDADLEGANLRKADLRDVDLRRARLVRADLRDADLRGAILLGADLRGAQLEGARMARAALVGAHMDAPETLDPAALWGAAPPHLTATTPLQIMTHGGLDWFPTSRELAFSPDGALLAVPYDDGTVRLWNIASGRACRVLSGHQHIVGCVSFSPDGRVLASASHDGTVRLWDVASGRERRVLSGRQGRVLSVDFSPDGQTLASGAEDGTIRLWDAASGREQRVLSGHQGAVLSVDFSPDGQTLASGAWDFTVRLWDVAHGRERHVLAGYTKEIISVTFRPAGQVLASASGDGTVCLWDVESGREIQAALGKLGDVRSVSFSPDGQTLASASDADIVRLWDVASGRERHMLSGHSWAAQSVRFSPDGQVLATLSVDNTVRLWDVASGHIRHMRSGHHSRVLSVCFSPDGQALALGSRDNTVSLWDVASGSQTQALTEHHWHVWSVSFSPDGQTLASGSLDNTVRLWDRASGSQTQELSGHRGSVLSVRFSPDGQTLASGCGDHTVRLWDIASGRERGVLKEHRGTVNSVSFRPDGQVLASASDDGTVRLWNVASGRVRHVLSGSPGPVYSVSFSPDGQTLASGSSDGAVRLWDVDGGKGKWIVLILSAHQGAVRSVSFSPDGKALASASDDHTVRLWDLISGRERLVLSGHQSTVTSVSFRPDGRVLASGSDDNTVRLWDVESGRCLGILVPCAEGWAALTPDGRYRMGGTIAGEVWYAVNLCRFELGELDPYLDPDLPAPLRLPDSFRFVEPAPTTPSAIEPAVPDAPGRDTTLPPATVARFSRWVATPLGVALLSLIAGLLYVLARLLYVLLGMIF